MSPVHVSRAATALQRACATVPTGATSAARLGVRPQLLFVRESAGCRMVDADGHELIDFGLANGPLLLGHDPEPVLEAVREQLGRGLLYGAQHALEAEVAELLAELVPSAEMTLLSTTGSEAVHAALRLARTVTGRRLVVRFEGHYHGWLDDVAYAGPGAPPAPEDAPLPLPSPALTGGMREPRDVAVLRWNDPDGVAQFFAARGGEVAAVILEPVPLAGLLEPQPGFLAALREHTRAHGALLVFDEVVTGFRLGPGGAQERFGVLPDLTVLGKALGAGMPVSAVVGARATLAAVADGRMAHMGTFNGHPVALAAAAAALRAYRDRDLHATIEARAAQLAAGLREAAEDAGVPLRVHQVGGVALTLFVVPGVPLLRYADLARADRERAAAFAAGLLERGVFVPPRGTWMVSAAHREMDVEEAIGPARGVLEAIAKEAG